MTRVWGVVKRRPHLLHRQRRGREREYEEGGKEGGMEKERVGERENDHVKVFVEFASAEDTRAVLTRCMGHGFGWRMVSGKRHYKHFDGKVPVMLWDYAEENSVREQFERERLRREGVVEGEVEEKKRKRRKVPFTWIYVHRWRGTKGRLEEVFRGVEGFERVVVGESVSVSIPALSPFRLYLVLTSRPRGPNQIKTLARRLHKIRPSAPRSNSPPNLPRKSHRPFLPFTLFINLRPKRITRPIHPDSLP